jgi:hypothetical protein
MKATVRDLKGRKIVDVKLRRFRDGRGGWATDPLLTLDDGRKVWFIAQETEVAEYGVEIGISAKVSPQLKESITQ